MFSPGAALALPSLLLVACVSLPNDVATPAPAAAPLSSNAVRCNCVVNQHFDDQHKGMCTDATVCPGPNCPCPGMDLDLCLPPDLNHDTATDPAVLARLAAPGFDFNAAVQQYCRTRAAAIMTDIGAVSQSGIICKGQSNSYFNVDLPALVNCQAVAWQPGSASTWHSATCASPCGSVMCVNGPKSERPNANCDGDDVFTRDGLHPEACHCNIVSAGSACDGKDSERFCSPPPGEAKQ